MILKIDINNKAKSPVSQDLIYEVAQKTLSIPSFVFLKNKKVSLSAALVSVKEMRELNKKCRKIDATTDVLSFAEYKNIEAMKKEINREIFLGELILCYNDIVSYAEKKKMKIRRELAEVIAHGVLHLMGLNHGSKMFKIQKEIAGDF